MTHKNSNGLGSRPRKKIVKGHVYWVARYTDPITKKQKDLSAKTEAEARQKLLEALARITTGAYVSPHNLTVGEWMDEWLERKKNLEPGTRAKYESAIRLYIRPSLGMAHLQDVRRIHCQDFVNSLTDKSPKYVHNIAGVLSDALQDAVRLELIARNPAQDLELPRLVKKDPLALSSEEQAALESAVRESPYCNVYLVALHTGARISEVLGLQWRNIDLKTGEMHITGQLERKQGDIKRALKDTTKNHKSRVNILPAYVVEFFRDERRRQNAYRLHAGDAWQNDDGLVFTREDGSPLPHRTVEHAFDRIKQRLGHPEWSLHTLRKTYITNQVHAGEDIKTVAAAVGHSASDITLAVYTAERREDMRAAADRRQQLREKSAPN